MLEFPCAQPSLRRSAPFLGCGAKCCPSWSQNEKARDLSCLPVQTLAYAGEKVLYSFQGGTDGALPDAGLIADRFGNLYGTTNYGGGGPCVTSRTILGCGTVFELSPDGKGNWNEAVLYAFTGDTDGMFPTPRWSWTLPGTCLAPRWAECRARIFSALLDAGVFLSYLLAYRVGL